LGNRKKNKIKTSVAVIGGLVAVVVIAAGVYLVDIDQAEEGSMSDVNTSVKGGNLPKLDAQTGSVNVTKEEADVEVPDGKITTEEKNNNSPKP
jgi:hypothetical protein